MIVDYFLPVQNDIIWQSVRDPFMERALSGGISYLLLCVLLLDSHSLELSFYSTPYDYCLNHLCICCVARLVGVGYSLTCVVCRSVLILYVCCILCPPAWKNGHSKCWRLSYKSIN